ncbi:hypothetical protein MY11210_008144 [Beauveria gryllotalpidicola]
MESGPPKEYSLPQHPQTPPPPVIPLRESFEQEAQTMGQVSLTQTRHAGQCPGRLEPARSDGQINRLQRENAHLRDTNRLLLQQIDSLQFRLVTMEKNLASQEAQIVRAQAHVFENVGSDTWAAGDDNTIRAEIERLQSRMKNWARINAIDEMSSLAHLEPRESAIFAQVLARVARLDGTDSSHPRSVFAQLTAGFMNNKSPKMCLQALLAHHVYSNIIGRPFFAIDGDHGTLQAVYRELKRGNVMGEPFRFLSSAARRDTNSARGGGGGGGGSPANEKEAHAWRSKMLQLLVKGNNTMNAHPVDPTDSYGAAQAFACRSLAEEFYYGPASVLIKRSETGGHGHEASQILQDLDAIVQNAGRLSSWLWSRRTALELRGLPELVSNPFTIRSDSMNAHALHRLFSDDDTSCDGWRVGLVVHPAVVGVGGGTDEDNTLPRVWMKAEVWLTELPMPVT